MRLRVLTLLVYGGLVLLVIPLQVVVIHQFAVGGIVPDVILLTVCLVGLWRGESEAVGLGLVLGLLQDLLSGTTAWLNLMTKPLLGVAVGIVGRTPISLTLWMIPILVMGVSLVSGLLVLLLLQARIADMDVSQALVWTVLPQAFYDGVFGAMVLLVVLRLFPTLHRRVWNP